MDRTVGRQHRDVEVEIEMVKVMEPRQEMINVTNHNTVWREPLEIADQERILLL